MSVKGKQIGKNPFFVNSLKTPPQSPQQPSKKRFLAIIKCSKKKKT